MLIDLLESIITSFYCNTKGGIVEDMEKLLFLGDLYYDYCYVENDIKKLAEWIKSNDYVVVLNMEGCIQIDNACPIRKRGPNLASSVRTIEVLKLLNAKGVCLANNHIMDYGEEAISETIKILDQNGIMHCGCGTNLNDALRPMYIEANGKRYSIFSFGWNIEETVYATASKAGCAPRDDRIILTTIQHELVYNQHVIVNLHWGFEYNRLPMPYDIALAHQLIDMGVELVIGHHPHCIQPMEEYRGKRIYYSLGDFYFSSRRELHNKSFPEAISNQSDYGLMVSVDGDCIDEFAVRYDRQKKESSLSDANSDILENLTGINYATNKYYKQVHHRKVNSNPILTEDTNLNRIKLCYLFIKRKTKELIKKIFHIR